MRTCLAGLVFLVLGGMAGHGETVASLPPTLYLPLIARETAESPLQPSDFTYLGAFRLPEGRERPYTFEYGGNAMTFCPEGDPSGPADGFPGSLFLSGHDRLPYSELPNGGQIAEIRIPAPSKARDVALLPRAALLQDFHNVAAGFFPGLDEIPRMGMQFLRSAATGAKIHLAWGQHFQETAGASHAWFDPNLSAPNTRGTWFIGSQSLYSVNDYMLEIPAAWAERFSQGRPLGTGRFRDGGWSGMGPALFAYRPWTDAGAAPADGTHLMETTLLLYQDSATTESIEKCLSGYQHPDEWQGAAWITTPGGKTAVLFAGTKGIGARYWYGYINPAGPDIPCVDVDLLGQFPLCRHADGTPCGAEDLSGCSGHNLYRGWWSSRFAARIIFYNPADLAQVARAEKSSWLPQPYAALDLDQALYLNPGQVETEMLGTGLQRRYRIGDMTYDRNSRLLYLLELFADGAAPVVHVWRLD